MTDPQAPKDSPLLPDWLEGDTRPRWKRPSTWLAVLLLAGLVAGGVAWQRSRQEQAAPRFVTEPVRRGDLATTVSANGTLQPTRSVSIGSELSGTVARVLVDVNDAVRKGQVLVELDTAKFKDQTARSAATLASAQASVLQAQAATREARAALARLEEVSRLSGGKVPAATELDSARATLDKAVAAEASARATVADAQAAHRTDETNLAKASIRSPIDGVVLTRSVDPGNAVAASLQAVTLFTLAEDLSRMKLSVNVDEADVGQVRTGQNAEFTVSAWPGRKYPATITRVAYGSTTTDNVVTYTTQLDVDNPDRTLRPGMTATATIAATERKGVLLVPNAALSFTPAGGAAVDPEGEGKRPGGGPGAEAGTAGGGGGGGSGGGILSKLMPRPPGMGQRRSGNAGNSAGAPSARPAEGQRRIWTLQQGRPVPVEVKAGLSSDGLTEVSGPGLAEGMQVITEQRSGTPS